MEARKQNKVESYIPRSIFPTPESNMTSEEVNQILLANYGCIFNDEGFLIDPDTNEIYSSEDNYDEVGDLISIFIQCKLKEVYGFEEIWIGDTMETNIFISSDYFHNSAKSLIIIQGSGAVRPGMWARSLCMKRGLEKGTMFPYIESAISLGYSIIILNPNNTKNPMTRKPIPGSETPFKHCEFVWNNFIRRCPASFTVLLAHSRGGSCTIHLLKTYEQEFIRKVKAIAFTDSVHKTVADLAFPLKNYLKNVARNWVKSQLTLGKIVFQVGKDGCMNVSAGHPDHRYTSYSAFPEIFPYFEGFRKKPTRKK